jgi:hypothetical protein
MPDEISETEALDFIKAIEDGRVRLQPDRDPQDIYAGNVHYTATNGWHITVFNDANEWDYIDCIQTSDGRLLDFSEIEVMPVLGRYTPSEEAAWSRYGIPGYCIFKCTWCGMRLTTGPPFGPPFLCLSCRVSR